MGAAGGPSPERATCISGPDERGNVWAPCPYTLDVSGGWYDAGDQGKYLVNGGIALWTLLDLYEREKRSAGPPLMPTAGAASRGAATASDDLLDEARWEMEFFLEMQVPDGTRTEASRRPEAQRPPRRRLSPRSTRREWPITRSATEHWTRLPTPPHLDRERRLSLPAEHRRDAESRRHAGAMRAHLADDRSGLRRALPRRCGARLGGGEAQPRSLCDRLLHRQRRLWRPRLFGRILLGRGRALHHHRQGRLRCRRPRLALFRRDRPDEPAWPRTASLGTISLALLPSGLRPEERATLRRGLVTAADGFLADEQKTGFQIPYAPAAWPWGSTSSILNRAIVLALASDFTGEARYRDGVIDAMDFILGRNVLDRSFVTGTGARPMTNPHHRFWTHQLDASMPGPPPGVLSGGPNSSPSDPTAVALRGHCAPAACWMDDARAFSVNEVAINWNAPLVWVSAWLAERP